MMGSSLTALLKKLLKQYVRYAHRGCAGSQPEFVILSEN